MNKKSSPDIYSSRNLLLFGFGLCTLVLMIETFRGERLGGVIGIDFSLTWRPVDGYRYFLLSYFLGIILFLCFAAQDLYGKSKRRAFKYVALGVILVFSLVYAAFAFGQTYSFYAAANEEILVNYQLLISYFCIVGGFLISMVIARIRGVARLV
jgi:hypothetical protein